MRRLWERERLQLLRVTFSDVVSATEPCKPCTECVGLQSMSAPCVEADDAVCRCAYGYYQDETTGRCEACRVCEAGSGLVFSCQDKQNTVCEECPDGTYSDEANHVDPCLPCTVCEDTERQLRECTRWADAECEAEGETALTLEIPHPDRGSRASASVSTQISCPWGPSSLTVAPTTHTYLPSMGSEEGRGRQLCPDKYPQTVQSPRPLALPLAVWQNGKSHPPVPGRAGFPAREAGNAHLAREVLGGWQVTVSLLLRQ
ncbi:hypothetical protein P7K49_011464 [Saguinus oedipus]|uniref:TNFR-Cys domain-containing protein n=1 Tax=Saguinus oedipus TaxID=9490 RepID=A0ABQ9VQR4_SAGOE|nr:hypothetical protein P7K49_011464 [Saguinus oedipus]